MHEQEMFRLTQPELQNHREALRCCWAALSSPQLYHQEIAIYNPHPTEFDVEYVFPRDMFLLDYHVESGLEKPSFEEIYKLVSEHNAPVVCTGSHREEIESTYQLMLLPPQSGNQIHMAVACIGHQSEADQDAIAHALTSAYKCALGGEQS